MLLLSLGSAKFLDEKKSVRRVLLFEEVESKNSRFLP